MVKKKKIKLASKQGWKVYNNFLMMVRAGVSYNEALANAVKGKISIVKYETYSLPLTYSYKI